MRESPKSFGDFLNNLHQQYKDYAELVFSYPVFKVDNSTLEVVHYDKNQDGIFQAENERLVVLYNSGGYHSEFIHYDTSHPGRFKQLGLPEFNGLNLRKWSDERRQVFAKFSEAVTLSDQQEFNAVDEFCQQRGLSFHEVLNLAQFMKPKTHAEQNKAMAVAALLLNVKKEKDQFYHLPALPGQDSNQTFIDKVLSKIKEGKLEIGIFKPEEGETELYSSGAYHMVKNQLQLPDARFDF